MPEWLESVWVWFVLPPERSTAWRVVRRTAAFVLVGMYGATLFGLVVEDGFTRFDTSALCVSLAAFFVHTFSLHIGLLAVVLAFVALKRKWQQLAGLCLPLVMFHGLGLITDILPKHPSPTSGDSILLASVNLLRTNTYPHGIIREIAAADPDVILFQEYTEAWHDAIDAALADRYAYVSTAAREDSFGMAVYSKLPFVGEVDYELPIADETLPQSRAVIRIGNRPVAVYNIHLWPAKSLENWKYQRWQFASLLELLEAERLPILLCGDFNFTTQTAFHRRLSERNLTDAHEMSGWGLGNTWPVDGVRRYLVHPGVRVDHVYLSRELVSTRCRTGQGLGSDHRPIFVEIAWAAR